MRHSAVVVAGLALLAGPSWAQTGSFVPAQTRVVIVPTVNTSGEKDEKQRRLQAERGDAILTELLAARGFQVVAAPTVREAFASLKLDMTDEENHRRAVLYDIGRKLDADIVVFVIVRHQDRNEVTWGQLPRTVKAQVKGWVLDVTNEKPIVNGVVQEGESGGGFAVKSSARALTAVDKGIKKLLLEFTKNYPVVKADKGR